MTLIRCSFEECVLIDDGACTLPEVEIATEEWEGMSLTTIPVCQSMEYCIASAEEAGKL